MKFEVNVTKRRFFVFLGAMILLATSVFVYAFGGNTPSTMGHSSKEIDFSDGINVGGDVLLRPASIETGAGVVCVDTRPGLIYERTGSMARVYVSGTDLAGTKWAHNCGMDPGAGNENEGKVLFAEWDWASVTGIGGVTVYAKQEGAGEPGETGSADVSATYTDSTPTNTRDFGDNLFPAPGAQYPSYVLLSSWGGGARYMPSPMVFSR